jgi:hypothetical protein
MSPRTSKYVEAMIREGDHFDYHKWLQKVRDEEAQAKQVPTAIIPREVVTTQVDNPINTSGNRDARPSLGSALISKPPLNLKAFRRPHRQAKSKTPNARLRRWLKKVHCAWGEFQGSRARDGVYIFLGRVFEIVMHYKVRRRTNRLLRHAFKFANLPFKNNADAFMVVLRSTCGNSVDPKTISKWARALRYVARSKEPDTELRKFMKGAGGINGCAARYSQTNGRTC